MVGLVSELLFVLYFFSVCTLISLLPWDVSTVLHLMLSMSNNSMSRSSNTADSYLALQKLYMSIVYFWLICTLHIPNCAMLYLLYVLI